MKKTYQVLSGIYFFTAVYAVVRYHLFGGVPWRDFPLFTLNKIIIFSTVLIWILLQSKKLPQSIKSRLYKIIYISVAAHVLWSVLVTRPYYLSKFFNPDGGLTAYAGWSLLAGSVAFLIFMFGEKAGLNKKSIRKGMLFFTAFHLFFMGFSGWINPQNWYGMLPPITLIAWIPVVYLFFRE